MKIWFATFFLFGILFAELGRASAMTPPPAKSLDERVELASHVIVGTAKGVKMTQWINDAVVPMAEEPKMLDMGQFAQIEVEVNEVLYPPSGMAQKTITYYLGGGMFSPETIRRDFTGKKWIFIMKSAKDKPTDPEAFTTSYGWNFMESLTARDNVARAVDGRVRREVEKRAEEKQRLLPLVTPATHVVVATPKNLRMLEVKAGEVNPLLYDPYEMKTGQYLAMELEVDEVLSPAGWKPEGTILFWYDKDGAFASQVRSEFPPTKSIFLMTEAPKKEVQPRHYLRAFEWKVVVPVESKGVVGEILRERGK